MKLTRTLGVAGALLISALVGGTLIGSTLAVDEETGTDTDRTAYCESFREAFAEELGVTLDELTTARKAAAIATVDAAEAAGDLDAERADRIRDRIQAADGTCDGLGIGFARGFARGFADGARHAAGVGVMQVAADELGVTAIELRAQLDELGSLEAVAEDRGVDYATLTAAILDAAQARLDEAVADGLDQDRADTMLEHLTSWLEDGGQVDDLGGGGFGPGGPGHRHGPGGRGPGMGPGWGTGPGWGAEG
jgi:hypothetical protein